MKLECTDLALAALLVLLLALLSRRKQLGLEGQLIVAATRTVVQLLLIGLVLESLFSHTNLLWISAIAIVMLLAAGREVMAKTVSIKKNKFTSAPVIYLGASVTSTKGIATHKIHIAGII